MLLRSVPENFNPQLHTEELSLASQMDKHAAVHNTVLSRFERYCKFTSFLFHTNRVNQGARQGWIAKPNPSQEVADNAYRVQYRSLNIKPAYYVGKAVFGSWYDANNFAPDMTSVDGIEYTNGVTSATVSTNVQGSIAVKHDPENNIFGDKFNPGDQMVLDAGLGSNLWILRKRFASTEDHYVYDFKVIGNASDFAEENIEADGVIMEGGNLFGEGSTRGYQRNNGTYWKIFYSFTSRYSLSFTGNSMVQKRVIWTDKTVDGKGAPGARAWQFEQEWLADEYFGIFLELACRFNSGSMDPSTHSWFESSGKNLLNMAGMPPELGIVAPRTGKGWVKQFKDTIDLSYDVNLGLSPYLLQGICNILASNSPIGQTGNTFVIVGDSVAAQNWDRGMKQLMGWNVIPGATVTNNVHNTNIVQTVTGGQKVELGFMVTAYHYLENKFVFMQDELMNHPGLNNRNGGLVGNGNMYFINVSRVESGVSNFELFTRGKGRMYRKVYVDGLFSLLSDQGNRGSSGFDGAFVHYLSELFPVVYFDETCMVLRGTGKYNGGALAGNAKLGNFPSIM